MNMFNRRKLMREYERGRTHFSLEHTFYMVTDQVMWITTAISTAKNVDTGDVEAVLYSVDVFRAKILEELLGAVSENDYDGVYLIDAKYNRAYKFSDIRRNPGRDIKENGVEYKTLLNRLMTRVPKDSEGYFEVFEMLSLENIRRELRHRSNYTVYYETSVEDGKKRHKKATFYTVDIPGDLICGTVQDISGVIENAMEMEAELQDALNKVQNALNSRNSILSRLSRDIRSPLSSIIGFAEIARSEIPDDTREAVYLDNIITAGASIHTIIDDMLTLHQIDRKGVVLTPERLDLAEFFGILEAKMLPSASERGLTFSIELGNHVPQQIMADRYRLEQVLTRLLENTFDYNANGGNVRLLVTEQKRESNRTTLRFAISDSSTGVNAEYLSSIFEPIDPKVIVQVDSPDQLDLGLTLAKSNVAAMGGRVEAQSLDDQGSCVTVTMTFPISYDRNETFTRLPAEAGRKFTFKGGRVLLVDDHKISLEIGVKMLERAGLVVDTAMNGEEALNAFRKAKGKYDIILMDSHMPLVDGLEATRKIRGEKDIGGDQIPIIAMTANAFEEDVKGSFAAGMNEHLTKPFSPQELYAVMSKFIE
jgi:signal transduction histidine kinase